MSKKRDVKRPTEARATPAIDKWAKAFDPLAPEEPELVKPKTKLELIKEEIAQLKAEIESIKRVTRP